MSDISASERRLSAALDRIDQFLEIGWGRQVSQPSQAEIDDLRAENARLVAELAALNEESRTRPDVSVLLAELDVLREERVNEQAQMGAIMAELERLLGAEDIPPATESPVEAIGDAGGVPEEPGPEGGFQQGEGR